MGMFDKDKEIGLILDQTIAEKDPFILWNARITNESYATTLGPAKQTTLTVSEIDDVRGERRYDVTTLAQAIAAKVPDATPDEFPAIVFWTKVTSKNAAHSDATVLRFIRPLNSPSTADTPEPVTADTPEPVAQAEIPGA